MKKGFFATILSGSFIALHLAAQTVSPPAIQWQRSFGGTNSEFAYCIRQTSDGGFIAGGIAGGGTGGNKTSPGLGREDYWVVRLNRHGDKLWDRAFGGDQGEVLFDLQQTADGGFILVGWSLSSNTGNKTSPGLGRLDGWVVRLDAEGNPLWDKSYGSTNVEELHSVQLTTNGGFVLAGMAAYPNPPDYWVLWIDGDGNVIRERTFGGSNTENYPTVRLATTGSYVIAGSSTSPASGSKTSSPFGSGDMWALRLDANGDKMWDRSYGGTEPEQFATIDSTADGGFVMAVASSSPASGNKTSPSFGMDDLWVVRVDEAGNRLWDQSFGGSGEEFAAQIRQTADGGYILAGSSASGISGNKTTPFYGGPNYPWAGGDFWVVRLDANGNKLWEQSFGGSKGDQLQSIMQCSDGGFILAGFSASPADGNKTTEQFGSGDFWVIKLAPDALSMPPTLRALPQSNEDIRHRGFRFVVDGRSNQNCVIEHSTDLVMWISFQTNRLAQPSLAMEDLSATNASARFYRARVVP